MLYFPWKGDMPRLWNLDFSFWAQAEVWYVWIKPLLWRCLRMKLQGLFFFFIKFKIMGYKLIVLHSVCPLCLNSSNSHSGIISNNWDDFICICFSFLLIHDKLWNLPFDHNQAMKFVISLCNLHGALALDTFQSGWLLSVWCREQNKGGVHTARNMAVRSGHQEGFSCLHPFTTANPQDRTDCCPRKRLVG